MGCPEVFEGTSVSQKVIGKGFCYSFFFDPGHSNPTFYEPEGGTHKTKSVYPPNAPIYAYPSQ